MPLFWLPQDINRHDTTPVLTYLYGALCIAALAATYAAGFEQTYASYAVAPREFLRGGSTTALLTPLTAAFLHSNISHLLFNLLFLIVFVDNIEYAFGRVRFVLFCVMAAYVSFGAQALCGPGSLVPVVGASGVIAAGLGAYFVLYPRAEIVFRPVGAFFHFNEWRWPAWVCIPFWFLPDALLLYYKVPVERVSVAYVAHVSGFIFGMVMARFLRVNYGYYELEVMRKALGRPRLIRTHRDDILNADYPKR